ncbi:MAG: hypothetical protein GX891_01190 [Clostridiales bacterium]|nr:hypothetical protein [Clostridiales bacterium]
MDTRIFVGSNTPLGFQSFYGEKLKNIARVYILKGGPGTGKNTLLKKIGQEASERGLDTEYWYCSGDPLSLDGIYIKKLNIAIVDGTAPHVIDATLPAVKETVVALGDYIDEAKVRLYSETIIELAHQKSAHYKRAYKALASARKIMEAEEDLDEGIIYNDKLTQLAASLAYHIRRAVPRTEQFSRAITPMGIMFFNDFMAQRQVIALNSSSRLLLYRFFNKLKNMLCGYDAYHCPFAPQEIEAMTVARYAVVPAELANGEIAETIELDTALKKTPVRYEFESAEFDRMFTHAVEELNFARLCHIEMEKYYIEAMDFDKVNEKTSKIIAEIFY